MKISAVSAYNYNRPSFGKKEEYETLIEERKTISKYKKTLFDNILFIYLDCFSWCNSSRN